MSFQLLSFERDTDGIVLITLNRPEKLNALNRAVISELGDAFRIAADDPAVKALILTGTGEKSFVAGADIAEIARTNAVEAEQTSHYGQEIFRMLETLRKPSVAAINGFALGGGLELAMCCTIRIASPNAKLGQPEVKLGIVPGYGGTQRLPRLVGPGRALDLLLSGEPIDAGEAHRIGLVNAIAPQDELIETAKKWARKVIANGPLAVALTMECVDTGLDAGLAAGLRFESMAFGLTAASDDRREGTAAFLEKRKAVFTGK